MQYIPYNTYHLVVSLTSGYDVESGIDGDLHVYSSREVNKLMVGGEATRIISSSAAAVL